MIFAGRPCCSAQATSRMKATKTTAYCPYSRPRRRLNRLRSAIAVPVARPDAGGRRGVLVDAVAAVEAVHHPGIYPDDGQIDEQRTLRRHVEAERPAEQPQAVE